jgi:hypothetical protein
MTVTNKRSDGKLVFRCLADFRPPSAVLTEWRLIHGRR